MCSCCATKIPTSGIKCRGGGEAVMTWFLTNYRHASKLSKLKLSISIVDARKKYTHMYLPQHFPIFLSYRNTVCACSAHWSHLTTKYNYSV